MTRRWSLQTRACGRVRARVIPRRSGCCLSGTRRRCTTTASARSAAGRRRKTCSRWSSWRRGGVARRNCRTTRCCRGCYGIATNVIRNQRRSERRFAAALRRMPEPPPEANFTDRADERLDDETQMRRALDLLAQLPGHEREVFALCAWMELSYEDAAFALGVPLGTVRSRLSRARRRLRELDPAIGHEEDSSRTVQEALEP